MKKKKTAKFTLNPHVDGNQLLVTEDDKAFFKLLVDVINANPRNYSQTLLSPYEIYSKRSYKMNRFFDTIRREQLVLWIHMKTPALDCNDFEYSLPTRCYWILTGRTDFPICPVCGKQFGQRKNTNYQAQYRIHCSINCAMHDPVVLDLKKSVNLERYGNIYSIASPIVREKIVQTFETLYRVNCPSKIPGVSAKFNTPEILKKINDTKQKNKTFNTSKPEEKVYKKLKDMFQSYTVDRQYRTELYPFNCDFHVKELDLFIECNFHWTHGLHWFDPTNDHDIDKLEKWKTKNTKFYDKAIYVWTVHDPLKRLTAEQNHLNYLVFWTYEEFITWCTNYHN